MPSGDRNHETVIAYRAVGRLGAADALRRYTLDVLPDLHGDLVEIGVRPTVLGGTVRYLYFSALAMFGFALMVSAAAIQSVRGIKPARIPLVVIAVIYTVFGLLTFLRSHSPHHLG